MSEEGVSRLTKRRKLIGRAMSESVRTVPHFFVTRELRVDVVLETVANSHARGDSRVTLTSVMLYHISRVLRRHPPMNLVWSGSALLEVSGVHLSVAVGHPDGVIAPVLRDLESLTPAEIGDNLVKMRLAVSQGKVSFDDLVGGTLTVSNLGMHGVDQFSAIITPPQISAIALGRVRTVPVLDGDKAVSSSLLTATVSADHRVVDGLDVALFLEDLQAALQVHPDS